MREAFLQLVRIGIGESQDSSMINVVDWTKMQALAEQQGLLAVALDGIDKMPMERRPKKKDILQWIGITLQQESQYAVQQKAAAEMAVLFNHNNIRTYVLKGAVVAECYPNPAHRSCSDLDCYLLPVSGEFDAWSFGNSIIHANGYEVETVYYKNSTFFLPGLVVENHKFLTPFRGNRKLKALERVLETLICRDRGENHFEGTWLFKPPVMVTALFLIEHAYSHFLHEGLTWKHVLDWVVFSKMHNNDIKWSEFIVFVDEFGFRRFYDSFVKMGNYLLGNVSEEDLSQRDLRMLDDIWAPLDLHDTARGVKGKLFLAGNTLRAWWKYHYFSEFSMLHALWIQVKGVLFEANPKLD